MPIMGNVTVHYGPEPLDGFMPMFRVAANLILEEMELFRKYGREPHLDLSTCSQYIRLRWCQTNRLKHQKPGDREFYEAIRERHSVRAASRLSLNVLLVDSDLCELNKL